MKMMCASIDAGTELAISGKKKDMILLFSILNTILACLFFCVRISIMHQMRSSTNCMK
jgi:hypothetical protein